jgi:hypothetical protein
VPEGSVARRQYERQEEGSVRRPGKELSKKTHSMKGWQGELSRSHGKETWQRREAWTIAAEISRFVMRSYER